MSDEPRSGLLTIRTVAMPADLNSDGDVFGGWLMGQMDIAGGMAARRRAKGRAATVAVDAMQFHMPMKLGDELCCYCVLTRVGRTSLTYRIEAWVERCDGTPPFMATQGSFTYVAIGPDGRPRAVPEAAPEER